MYYKEVKRLVKILAKAAKRRGHTTREAKAKEMDNGLTAMGLIVCRQKRDRGLSSFSYETLDHVNKIIQSALISRSKEISFG
tara:strand:+ start:83 stop:328 length:246 start_codon:yes stop_codon:yes gene_type:complete